jgi:hypothetical protein
LFNVFAYAVGTPVRAGLFSVNDRLVVCVSVLFRPHPFTQIMGVSFATMRDRPAHAAAGDNCVYVFIRTGRLLGDAAQ